MMAATAPYSKKQVRPTDFRQCIFDEQIDPVTAEEYEVLKTAWKLN